MTTALLTFIMVVLFSLQSLFLKLFSVNYESQDASRTSGVFSITYGVFVGLATLAVAGFHFAPSGLTWLMGCLNAVALLVYNTSMIQASRLGSYSFQMLCVPFGGILVPMIYGAVALGERMTPMHLAAVGLMLISFVLMNLKGLTLKGSKPRFLIWCFAIFMSNGIYGVLMNEQQARMAGAQRNEMIVLTFLLMAILYTAIQLVRDPGTLKAGWKMSKKSAMFLTLCCVVAAVAAHLMLYILTLVNETVLYTVNNGGVLVLSVLYSCILFKEKLSATQLIGAALAVISIVMLSV